MMHLGGIHRRVRRGPDRGGTVHEASLVVVSSGYSPRSSGTVIMLIAATVMPLVFDTMSDVQDGTSSAAAPTAAVATLIAVAVLVLRAPPAWRLRRSSG